MLFLRLNITICMKMLTLCRTHNKHTTLGYSNYGSEHEPSKCWRMTHTHNHDLQQRHFQYWLNGGEPEVELGKLAHRNGRWPMIEIIFLKFLRIMWIPLYLALCMYVSVDHLFCTGFLTKLFVKLHQLNLLATLS